MLQFSIMTISVFVTLINNVVIYIADKCFNKDIKRYIPIVSIVVGIVLGLVGYFSGIDMGKNWIEAFFIGLSAGGSAVGINQIGKQLNKVDCPMIASLYDCDEDTETDKTNEDTENEEESE